ncbi:MAG: hypothetical protein ACI4EN_10420 [Butyrivibrio sp.]
METIRELKNGEKIELYFIIRDSIIKPIYKNGKIVVENCPVETKIPVKEFINWRLCFEIISKDYIDREMDVMFRNGFLPVNVKPYNGAHINFYEISQNKLEEKNIDYELHVINTDHRKRVLIDKKVSFMDIDYVFR